VITTTSGPARPVASEPTPTSKSVAVLPLVNVGGDPTEEYFSDGMTDELTSALGKIPGLRVAARSSAFTFKGKTADAREVGEKLRVATVLEGSVRRAGPRLRIAAQLVNAADGLSLWSETYERELKDVFQVQEDIARSIAGALRLTLGRELDARLAGGGPRNLEAHDLYLRGRFYYIKYTEPDLRRSLALYQQALARDSTYAPAWAGTADAWSALADDYLPPREAYPKARAAARRAIALDPTLAEAHASLGLVLHQYDWDFAAAEHEYQRAIALNPNAADAYHYYGYVLLSTPARLDSALAVLRRAQSLDPLSAYTLHDLGWVLQLKGHYGEAIEQCRQALELDPHAWLVLDLMGRTLLLAGRPEEALRTLRLVEDPPPHVRAAIGRSLVALGRREEARRVLGELEREAARRYVRPEAIAEVYVALGEPDAAFRWLEAAYLARSTGVLQLQVERHWDPIRSDPRFAALVKKVGIP
jgi:TolB-like protein/Flp pilus assembly protein TadD